MAHFSKLRAIPDECSDFHGYAPNGRRLEISIHAGFAISYWIDFTDRHVNVVRIQSAD
jgi:hypothetical protein